jgi:hypothetical protein
MIQQILLEVKEFNERIQKLKENSPYYPRFLKAVAGREIYFSTLVRVKHNEIWYTVHSVSSGVCTATVHELDVLAKFMHQVYRIQHCWNFSNPPEIRLEEQDILQVSEQDRISQDINYPRIL